MIKSIYSRSFILISINNFRKVLFNFYNLDSVLKKDTLFFFSNKNTFYICIGFELKDYFSQKHNVLNILEENSIYFNLLAVKYDKNFHNINNFENMIKIHNENILTDIIIFGNILFLQNNVMSKFFIFYILNIILLSTNNIKCQLFINQLQN